MDRLLQSTKEYVDWWKSLGTKKQNLLPSAADSLVTVEQLPMYAEDFPIQYKFIEDEPTYLEGHISTIRRNICEKYDKFVARFELFDMASRGTANAIQVINGGFREEWSFLPKATAITVGGLAGFVLGLKRSTFRRALYTGVGLICMTTFCYPNETVSCIQTGLTHGRFSWDKFKESPSSNSK